MKSRQVSHLLLGPSPDHLSWVFPPIALPETELSGDILVPVFEDKNRGFVYLDRAVFALLGGTVVDVGLLASRNAAIDLRDESPVEKLEQNHPSPGVHDLLNSRAI